MTIEVTLPLPFAPFRRRTQGFKTDRVRSAGHSATRADGPNAKGPRFREGLSFLSVRGNYSPVDTSIVLPSSSVT